METKLKPYRGKLSIEQIVDGMNAAVRNARRLADDAKKLLDWSSFPSAAALAILSIEESGKVSVLRLMSIASDERGLRSRWKDYTSHRKKNSTWILPALIEKGDLNLNVIAGVISPKARHPAILDQIKQLSLYTDCLERFYWSEPEKVIDKKMAGQIVDDADKWAIKRMFTVRELELWVEHMKPVCNGSLEDVKEATFNLFKAIKREGLPEVDGVYREDLLQVLFETDT